MPENNFHSTMLNPDSVKRVTPPTNTMSATIAMQAISQIRALLGAVIIIMLRI